jgi:transposase
MSDSLNDQPHLQDDRAAAQGPDAAAPQEQQPDAAGVGRAQRSEPERSGGERSGARPTPATSPSSAPGVTGPAEGKTNVPYEESLAGEEEDVPGVKLAGRSKGRRLVKKDLTPAPALTPEKRLLLLDTWQRSGLPAKDFAALVGMSKFTLYTWKKKFDAQGPAGLLDQPKGGPRGSRLPELTKRTILMLKQANPEWGCQRISDMLVRGPALPASASAVALVLHEAGYQ